jgi:citrate lyase subunit beta/citryl-CoA lyase
MMQKATRTTADAIMLDLEDAVSESEKDIARDRVIDALQEEDWDNKQVSVRINGLGTPYAHHDLLDIVERAGDILDALVIPKISRPSDVYTVETLLRGIELDVGVDDSLALQAMIENTKAILSIDDIASASDRLETLIFGPGDYAASQGLNVDGIGAQAENIYPGDVWHHARNKMVIAARAYDLDAIDGAYGDFSDTQGFRKECIRSNTLGYIGKQLIHPSQIEIANEVYVPTAEEIERSKEIMEAKRQGDDDGRGAVRYGGEMHDEASVRMAERVLERAREAGLIE